MPQTPPQSNHQELFSSLKFRPETTYQAFMEAITNQLVDHLLKWQPLAIKSDDTLGTHKTRVSVRQTRTALNLSKPYYTAERLTSLLANLKIIGDNLGSVRDLDVFRGKFESECSQQSQKIDFIGLIWMPVFGDTYQNACITTQSLLESILYDKTIDDVRNLFEIRLPIKETVTHPEALPSILANQQHRIYQFAYLTSLTAPYKEYHRLRLALKEHRYTLEFFESVLNPALALQVLAPIITMQDYLGELNDCVVGQKILAKAIPARSKQKILAAYQQELKNTQHDLINNFPSIWKSFSEQLFPEGTRPFTDWFTTP